MRILSRYFLASYLNFFVAILFASMAAVTIVEILLNFDDILARQDGPRGVLTYLFLRIPSYYLRDLLPVTSFAAGFFCLGLPARAHEITAIKTGGISPRRTALPILAAAAVLSGVALAVNESIVLTASRQWNALRSPGEQISFRQGSFWYHRGDAIYNVEEADRESRTLHGVSVFELSDQGRLLVSTRARTVEIGEDQRWKFVDATTRRFDPMDPEAPPQTETLPEHYRDFAVDRDLMLLEASARTLSLWNLMEYIAAREDGGRDSGRFRDLLHTRLAEPFTVLLFALLAVPLGLAVERTHSLAASALSGVILIAIFYAARTTMGMFAAGGFVGSPGSANWEAIAASDLNADGTDDIILRNLTIGVATI